MKLIAVTYGTEGDARPITMLCRALMDAGHEVTLLADGGTLGSARALGVPHAALAGDIRGALKPGDGIASVVSAKTSLNATAQALARIANENATAWMRQTVAAAAGCDALIVSGLISFVGLSVAEHLAIPAIGAAMFPITPTAAFPSPFLPPNIPGWLNRLSHHFVNAMLWRAFRRATNVARVDVCGLPPRRGTWSGHPMLYGVSPSLLPRPADWPANAHVCGQWVQPVRDWDSPQKLREFLAAGEAPIYVGFGSMVGFDRRALFDAVVTAVAGRRALFYPGWSGMQGLELPANFFTIDETPHDWLFPRMSLVIHHGGSGTSHSAARAGVPSVVLPFAGDQFFWAEQLRRHGVAPAATSGREISADALSHAIDAAHMPQMRDRAAALGARMRTESGLATGVERIRELVTRSGDDATGPRPESIAAHVNTDRRARRSPCGSATARR